MTSTTDTRAAYTAGLRQLADALDQHPEIKLPDDGQQHMPISVYFWDSDIAREAMGAAARALPTSWIKNVSEQYLRLRGQLAGLHIELVSQRDAVCTRRVVGTEDQPVEVVVTPAVTRTEIQPVEIVVWDCQSILRPAVTEPAAVAK